MIAVQCKMARAALGLGVRELADLAKVSPDTVARLERGEELRERTVDAIRAALEAAGVEFTNGGQPGVRMKASGMGDKIYVDAGQSAVLEHGAMSIPCFTVQEAKIEFDKLPPDRKSRATMTIAGRKYSASEIERFHYGPGARAPSPSRI
jgi:transcriptional regulator with XRE-family HTH domain